MGGDELSLEIEVGAGSALVLTEASATLLLPGADGARSRLQVRVTVESGGTFAWLPEPMIAARGCHHVTDIAVELASDARLREELLLGRRGEDPGRLRQQVRVRRDGRALNAQELRLDEKWATSPAVVGGHRAVGSMLVVDPALLVGDGALLPPAGGHAVLAHGLAADSIGLRRQLEEALTKLGPPRDPWAQRHTDTARSTQEAG